MKEDALRLVGSGFTWIGIAVGYLLGVAVTKFQAARNSLKGARDSVPGFRKLYWGMLFRAGWMWVIVGALVAVSLLWLGAFSIGNSSSTPASVPTVSPGVATVSPHK